MWLAAVVGPVLASMANKHARHFPNSVSAALFDGQGRVVLVLGSSFCLGESGMVLCCINLKFGFLVASHLLLIYSGHGIRMGFNDMIFFSFPEMSLMSVTMKTA